METTNNDLVTAESDPVPLERRSQAQASVEPELEDVDAVRENLRKIVARGTRTLENLFDIADSAEHPKLYEVLATLMNSVTKANRDLLDVSQTKRKIEEGDGGEDPPDSDPRQVHNHMYVGSTAELLQVLDRKKREDEE